MPKWPSTPVDRDNPGLPECSWGCCLSGLRPIQLVAVADWHSGRQRRSMAPLALWLRGGSAPYLGEQTDEDVCAVVRFVAVCTGVCVLSLGAVRLWSCKR